MKKGKWFLKCVLAGILFLVLVGLVTMLLWNWLVPELFNGPQIAFFQALGLLLLSKIFFGGLGRGRWAGGRSWKHRYEEKLSGMSPEARERFKSRMREKWRCGDVPRESADKTSSID
jgi:hypothetical protein